MTSTIVVTTAPSTRLAASACTPLAWTCGSLPDAYDTKTLSGKVNVVHDKSSSGADVEATVLALDVPVCDSRGGPVTSIQIDSDHAAFAGKHVSVVLKHFITARSDEVHVLGVIGSSESSDPDAVTAYDDNANGLIGMSADEVEAVAGTPRLDLGGSEGEACFVFACNSRNKVCFAPGTEQASWKQVLRTNARVESVAPVSEQDKAFARSTEEKPTKR